jgi:putative DNA primase/helicase
VKAEFDRLNIEERKARRKKAQKGGGGKKGPDPRAKKVTTALLGDVRQALTDLCLVPSTVTPPAWLLTEGEWSPGDVLACRNGLAHLPSVAAGGDCLIAPTPVFFSPNSLDYDFDLDAPPCREWLTFLARLWEGDEASVRTLQEWMEYTLLPDSSQQKIMMLVGPPRSGKGTIARVHRCLIGEANVCNPTLSSLAGNFGLQPLLGKTLAIISDARLSHRTDLAAVTERLLSISGEDGQTVERKHLPAVDSKLPVRFMILTNELPRLTDSSGAIVSRMLVLRFTRSWLGREDIRLTDRLMTELPGILLWAIEGWRRLRERGYFVQPESGRPLVNDLENLASPVRAFVRECCVVADGVELRSEDAAVQVRELFGRWKCWCEEKGRRGPGDEQMFGRDLRSVVPFLEVRRPRLPGTDAKGPREYRGIRLKSPEEENAAGADARGEGE